MGGRLLHLGISPDGANFCFHLPSALTQPQGPLLAEKFYSGADDLEPVLVLSPNLSPILRTIAINFTKKNTILTRLQGYAISCDGISSLQLPCQ